MMDLWRFRELNKKRQANFGHEHTPGELVACIAEEHGEVAACVLGLSGAKKRKAHLTINDLARELADMFTYMDLLAAHYGIDLADAIRTKFNEVSVRVDFSERF